MNSSQNSENSSVQSDSKAQSSNNSVSNTPSNDTSQKPDSKPFQVNGSLGSAQKSQPGLYVENGVVKLAGNPFYGIGTNYYDAYLRQITNPLDGDIEKGIKRLTIKSQV